MQNKKGKMNGRMMVLKSNLIKPMLALMLSVLLFGFTTPLNNKTDVRYEAAAASSVKIVGTSTMHDWEMESDNVSSAAEFIFDEGDRVKIKDITFSVKAKSLKSSKSKLDNNAYERLEAEKYPTINYKSTGVKRMSADGGTINMPGQITVAGNTQSKTVEMNFEKQSKGKWICTGQTELLMSDFGIEPPTMMGGMLKTGDEVVVHYKIIFTE